jgi:predicted ATPase
LKLETVCEGKGIESDEVLDLLAELANKSLVMAQRSGIETRYRRLESIRQYAREKLVESGELEQLCNLHLNYFLQLSEQAETALRGPTQISGSHLNDDVTVSINPRIGRKRT